MKKEKDVSPIIIGQKTNNENKHQGVFITDNSRFTGTMILGTKHSGKSRGLAPFLIKQDLENKNACTTIISNQSDLTYEIYAMAKKIKRRVHILKPEVNFEILNKFIWMDKWDYDYINKNIINYKEAIKNKDVVIIDMEYSRYKDNAVRATIMLLLQLQSDMCETTATLNRRHYIYIDDANKYLPFIEQLLTEGDTYNTSTTLLIQGRNQLKTDKGDYTPLVDNNIRNTILMTGINYDDALYYGNKLYPIGTNKDEFIASLLNRKYGEICYEIVGADWGRYIGKCNLLTLNKEYQDEILKLSKKYKNKLKISFEEEIISKKIRAQSPDGVLPLDADLEQEDIDKKREIFNDILENTLSNPKETDLINKNLEVYEAADKANTENIENINEDEMFGRVKDEEKDKNPPKEINNTISKENDEENLLNRNDEIMENLSDLLDEESTEAEGFIKEYEEQQEKLIEDVNKTLDSKEYGDSFNNIPDYSETLNKNKTVENKVLDNVEIIIDDGKSDVYAKNGFFGKPIRIINKETLHVKTSEDILNKKIKDAFD